MSKRSMAGSKFDGDQKADEMDDPKLKTNIDLPEWKDYETIVPAMKVFPTMYETDVNDIKDTFDSFIAILKERKEAALKQAQIDADAAKFDDANPDPVKIDTAECEGRIKRCGTSIGEAWYELERHKISCTDQLSWLIECEDKLRFVGGDFDKTKSVKGIKNAIGKVEKALKVYEPILQGAKDAVKDISKSSLDEIRALPKPHKLLVKAVQACALLIGTPEKDCSDWKDIRKLLKTTFINNLIAFEGTDVDSKLVDRLEKDFLGRGNDDMKDEDKLTYDNVNKANAVAGSLVKWLEAQLKYNEMLPQVNEKQKELKDLNIQLALMDGSSTDLANAIKILEKRVETSKDKVRSLIKKYAKMQKAYEEAVVDYENEPPLES